MGYWVTSPVAGSSLPTTSISIEVYQIWSFLSIPSPYGVGLGPGSWNSLNVSVLGSKRPIFPARYSPNQIIPLESILSRRGRGSGLGGVYFVTLFVFTSTLPILPFSVNSANQTVPSLSTPTP